MARPPRKKPPKFDHVALGQSFVARPPTEAEARVSTVAWLKVEDNVERLLEAVASGQSVRRFCERERIAYSPVQRALTSPALEPRYRQAQEQQGEHLLGEMERISGLIEAGELDPKAGSVIIDTLKWRMARFNSRWNERQVIEQHTFDHTKAHIDAVRQLAQMGRVVQVGDGLTKPALVHQADRIPIDVHTRPTEQVQVGEYLHDPVPAREHKDDPVATGTNIHEHVPAREYLHEHVPTGSSMSGHERSLGSTAEPVPAGEPLEGELVGR